MENKIEQLELQQKRFNSFVEVFGNNMAIFYCCIAFDIPFEVVAVPRDDPEEVWIAYLDNLEEKGLDVTDEEKRGFLDGLTDITKIFGVDLQRGEFNKAISLERSSREALPGTKAQRAVWGKGSNKKPYTTEDYKELDRLFSTFSARLESSGGYDTQQEYILRLCSRMSLDMQKYLESGYVDKAQKLNRMIQENLASENLRKKDAKPLEDIRIDSIVDRLEKAGLLKNGKQCDPDEMFRILFCKPPKYSYTKDAAEQIILINENRMRNNDGIAELETLPDEMRLKDELGEFTETPSAQEQEAYEKLGLVKMPPVKKTNDDGEVV